MQYELESYTRQLRALDGQIAYSTVNVTLREVATLTPTGITFPERLWDAFSGGWSAFVTFLQGLILTLVYLWPLLLIAAAVVFAVRSLSRRHRAAHPETAQTAKARQGRAARLPHRTHGPPAPALPGRTNPPARRKRPSPNTDVPHSKSPRCGGGFSMIAGRSQEEYAMDIWEQLYLRAKEQYAPQEISPFLYARHVVCALESADGPHFYRFLHGKLLRCDGPVRRAGAGLNMYLQSGQTSVRRLIAFRDAPPSGGGTRHALRRLPGVFHAAGPPEPGYGDHDRLPGRGRPLP